MLLSERMSGEVLIQGEANNFAGRPYWEASLVSDDGQTLYLYEGQLKEVPHVALEAGQRYRITFQPFINNRWVEVKVVDLVPLEG
jgi:hypothetical protein